MALQAGNLTREEARTRAGVLSVVSYDIDLDLTADGEEFRSTTTVTFDCAEAGTESFLDLSARSVSVLQVNGEAVAPQGRFDGTRLALPPLAEGRNEARVVATCEYQHTGVGLHRFIDPTDGGVYLHTQFEPFDAHRVFACFDQPDLKAEVSLKVDAPPGWVVVSNAPVEEREGGRWAFATTPRLSTYLVAVVAGPYEAARGNHRGVPLALWCRRSMLPHLESEELFDLTKRGLDFFTDAFGSDYPFSKYDQLFVPEFVFGAMENPGCVTFSENYLFRGRVTEAERESRANTLLHEMAHMWFGDLVTMRWWGDLWLNESFATFMATLALQRATRFTNSWVTFANEEKAWARRQDQLPTTHPIATDATDVETVLQNFDGITYAKGASVLRQLVAWVGEEPFLEGCRSYFRRYAYGNADLGDFLAELEGASGRDLASWAKEWLETAGINTLRPRWEADDGAYRRIEVEQEAPDEWPVLRSHRVAVGLFRRGEDGDGSGLRLRRRVELDISGPVTEVPDLAGERLADLVVVNHDDLTFAKLQLDPGSLDTVTNHLSDIDDPLARTLCWSAAWEMVRDAALPARAFVDLVATNAAAETDVGVVQTLLGRAVSATLLYGDPAHAAELLGRLATDARGEVDASAPGSGRELAWARHWMATARTPPHLDEIRGLLAGERTVGGLEMDTELRWHATKCLAAVGAVGEEEIAAEQERDPTDLGERNAATAQAARPDPAAKQAAWARVVGEPDLSHSMMKAIMGGFARLDQPELIRPYVEQYFDALLPMWQERQMEVALAFAARMYPTAVVDDDVVAATDRMLDRGDLPRPLRRALLEQRDTVVRALRARAADRRAGQSSPR